MKLIAHRGNINGPSPRENEPNYIEEALSKGYDVEIDVWYLEDDFWLGHDGPTYKVEEDFLLQPGLWCHAKNFEALVMLKFIDATDYFWHQNDDYTLTSSGYVWTYPGKMLGKNSIAVMPETVGDVNSIDKSIYGICSDYVQYIDQEGHPQS